MCDCCGSPLNRPPRFEDSLALYPGTVSLSIRQEREQSDEGPIPKEIDASSSSSGMLSNFSPSST